MLLHLVDDVFTLSGGIGLFDSGVGGLTVLRPLLEHEPRWPTVMVADQAHVPYGGRPLEEVRGFALAQTEFLFGLGVDRVVMACNISSATALDTARDRWGPDRVFGMVEPGCELALDATRAGRIGVLATEGTVRSGAYPRKLAALDPSAECVALACPEFVPLVEAEHTDDELARRTVTPYVERLRREQVDVAILGCTHYPHLLPVLRTAAPEIAFVDPAAGILRSVRSRIGSCVQAPRLLTSGSPEHLRAQVARLLPEIDRSVVGRVIWREPAATVDDDPTRAVP